jgi:penicillin-binding protein 1B
MRGQKESRNKIHLRGKKTFILLGAVSAFLVILCSLYAGHLLSVVTERFEGDRWKLPSKIYSDSFILHAGQDVNGIHLIERLTRLDYRPVSGHPEQPGEYWLTPEQMEISLHDFKYPDTDFNGFTVHFTLDHGKIVAIKDLHRNNELSLVELEPELIAGFYDETWEERNLVQLDDVPLHLTGAILAIEDARFYHHFGLDPVGIARALWINIKSGAIVQGGSTLTQQLVKNFYLDKERTISRKTVEALMAILLEAKYTKDEILEAYLNEIYMGQSGTMGIYGVGEAARFYFGKRPRDLTLGESALLAGLISAPNAISPYQNLEKATERRDRVLDRMQKLKMITGYDYHRALQEKIIAQPPVEKHRKAPYFIDFLRQQLIDVYSPEVLVSEGLRIFTTLDTQLQHQAEASLHKGIRQLESRYPVLYRHNPQDQLQGLLIALRPQTGHIKAMVGGRDYTASQFNRITQARRQPGSLFKLFVYAAAIQQEFTFPRPAYTGISLLDDSPFTLSYGNNSWSPENYDKTYHGTVTLRTAFEKSLNVATAKLAQEIGIDHVADTARALGIQSDLNRVPSLALGTSEVVPLEMAVAYGTIANGGTKVDPKAIKEVVDSSGRVLERRTLKMEQVLTPQQAYLLTHFLKGVVDRGTAHNVRNLGFYRPVAGKTGTSSMYRDAWFAGYTPDMFALTWVGFDQYARDLNGEGDKTAFESQEVVSLTGAVAAVPIWVDFMKKATAGLPETDFPVPPGIVVEEVDQQTGLVSGVGCPEGIDEIFIKGTEPTDNCHHSIAVDKGLVPWFRNLFQTH